MQRGGAETDRVADYLDRTITQLAIERALSGESVEFRSSTRPPTTKSPGGKTTEKIVGAFGNPGRPFKHKSAAVSRPSDREVIPAAKDAGQGTGGTAHPPRE